MQAPWKFQGKFDVILITQLNAMFLEISETLRVKYSNICQNTCLVISVHQATSKHKHQIIIGKTFGISVALLASSQKCLRANENRASRKFQGITATEVHFNVQLFIARF